MAGRQRNSSIPAPPEDLFETRAVESKSTNGKPMRKARDYQRIPRAAEKPNSRAGGRAHYAAILAATQATPANSPPGGSQFTGMPSVACRELTPENPGAPQ